MPIFSIIKISRICTKAHLKIRENKLGKDLIKVCHALQ